MKIKPSMILVFSLFCATTALAQGSISGRLLKSNGKPLPYTEIELVPVSSKKQVNNPKLLGISDSAGRFVFPAVPSGKYTLSINFGEKPTDLSPYETFFYPATRQRSEAEVFDIEDYQKFEKLVFKLPPALAQRKITGKVVDETGNPVSGALLALRDLKADQGVFFGLYKTGKLGEFSFNAFVNRRYQVAAVVIERFGGTIYDPVAILGAAESDVFTLGELPVNLKLTIVKRPDYDEIRNRYIGQITPINNIFRPVKRGK